MKSDKAKNILDDVFYFLLVAALVFILVNYDLTPKKKHSQKTAPAQTQQEISEPVITGPPQFQEEVAAAISVMKEKAPSHYKALCKYVTNIELSNQPPNKKAMAWTNSKSKTIFFDVDKYNRLSDNKMYIIIAMIAHETAHQIQYRDMQVTEIREIESQAVAAERDVLIKLGAPPETINLIAGEHILNEEWWKD